MAEALLTSVEKGYSQVRRRDANKSRSVTLGVSGGGSLTRLFRDARRFPSTGLYPVPRAACTARNAWALSIVKGPFSVRRARPYRCDSQLVASLAGAVAEQHGPAGERGAVRQQLAGGGTQRVRAAPGGGGGGIPNAF